MICNLTALTWRIALKATALSQDPDDSLGHYGHVECFERNLIRMLLCWCCCLLPLRAGCCPLFAVRDGATAASH